MTYKEWNAQVREILKAGRESLKNLKEIRGFYPLSLERRNVDVTLENILALEKRSFEERFNRSYALNSDRKSLKLLYSALRKELEFRTSKLKLEARASKNVRINTSLATKVAKAFSEAIILKQQSPYGVLPTLVYPSTRNSEFFVKDKGSEIRASIQPGAALSTKAEIAELLTEAEAESKDGGFLSILSTDQSIAQSTEAMSEEKIYEFPFEIVNSEAEIEEKEELSA